MRLFVIAVLGGCWVGGPAAPVAAPDPSAMAIAARPHDDGALVARDTMFVAGCNAGCTDCGLGNYTTFVVGTLARTGARVFPGPEPLGPGYSCAATIDVGERVILSAHSPDGLAIVRWAPFASDDYCPCAGTAAAACRVDVTPEIAAHYKRVYCGATWAAKPKTAIAH